jgi:antitoxin component of MazEF toxin-antitoxin module
LVKFTEKGQDVSNVKRLICTGNALIMAGQHNNIVTDVTHFRKAGKSMCLTVPKGVRVALDWVEGQAILIRAEGNRIFLESLVEHMATAISAHEQQNNTRG